MPTLAIFGSIIRRKLVKCLHCMVLLVCFREKPWLLCNPNTHCFFPASSCLRVHICSCSPLTDVSLLFFCELRNISVQYPETKWLEKPVLCRLWILHPMLCGWGLSWSPVAICEGKPPPTTTIKGQGTGPWEAFALGGGVGCELLHKTF